METRAAAAENEVQGEPTLRRYCWYFNYRTCGRSDVCRFAHVYVHKVAQRALIPVPGVHRVAMMTNGPQQLWCTDFAAVGMQSPQCKWNRATLEEVSVIMETYMACVRLAAS